MRINHLVTCNSVVCRLALAFLPTLLAFVVVQPGLPAGFCQSPPVGYNYDEAKVGAYTLPDPLVMASGKRVANSSEWTKRR